MTKRCSPTSRGALRPLPLRDRAHPPGISALLEPVHESSGVPAGVLPGALYDLIEKAGRLPWGFFAGPVLLSVQVGLRYGALRGEAVLLAVRRLEEWLREVAHLPGRPSPDDGQRGTNS
jgi:hypothetical protein